AGMEVGDLDVVLEVGSARLSTSVWPRGCRPVAVPGRSLLIPLRRGHRDDAGDRAPQEVGRLEVAGELLEPGQRIGAEAEVPLLRGRAGDGRLEDSVAVLAVEPLDERLDHVAAG